MPRNSIASNTQVNCVNGVAGGYPCKDIDMLAYVSLNDLGCTNANGNDIWGWTDANQNEYVIAGCESGTSFVDVTDPVSPVVLGFLPTQSASSNWRDMKVYNGHAYIGSEAGGHGIQVMDLSQLSTLSAAYRANPTGQLNLGNTFTATAVYTEVSSSHNVVINEESGYLYIVGGRNSAGGYTCNGGLHMVDIRNPTNPIFAGCYQDDGYTHDAQCVIYRGPDSRYTGKEICFAYNEDTITIVDVTIKTSPVLISKVSYSVNQYTHQGWLNEQQTHLLLDDELDELYGNLDYTRTLFFDVTLLDNPTLNGQFVSSQIAIDHNQYTRDDKVYQANYCAGLRILDISRIAEGIATEEAFFQVQETCPTNPGFSGAWSNYPYFPSRTIAVQSIERGLFLLKYNMAPTATPTFQPTGPTAPPTFRPTAVPTTASPTSEIPTEFPLFQAAETNNAMEATVDYTINVCPGTRLAFSLCPEDGATRVGDTYLRLFDAAGIDIANNDDACQTASKITHLFDQPCQTYTLKHGCFSINSCSGQTKIIDLTPPTSTASPTVVATTAPTAVVTAAPTAAVTVAPTAVPGTTNAPTLGGPPATFLTFETSFTDSAQTNTVDVEFIACGGDSYKFSLCGHTESGDTYLRLKDAVTNIDVSANDDSCGLVSEIDYQFPSGGCRRYKLVQGCYGSQNCKGTTHVINNNPTPATASPTFSPTDSPTAAPTAAPTATSTATPTATPTVAPTVAPSLAIPPAFPPFSASNTADATINTVINTVNVCHGTVVEFATCNEGKVCNGDTFLRLYDAANHQIASNDDRCGFCSRIKHTFTGPCQTYSLHQGCFRETNCGGQVKLKHYPSDNIILLI